MGTQLFYITIVFFIGCCVLFSSKRRTIQTPKPVSPNSWTVDGIKVTLGHITESPPIKVSPAKDARGLRNIFSALANAPKESHWKYSVLPDHVLVRGGGTNMKAQIHFVESSGLHFVRLPVIGNLVVENKRLRAPSASETFQIKSYEQSS